MKLGMKLGMIVLGLLLGLSGCQSANGLSSDNTSTVQNDVMQTEALAVGFDVTLSVPSFSLAQGGSAAVQVKITRQTAISSYTGPLEVKLQGLPAGVTAPNITIPAGSSVGTLQLSATGIATVGIQPLKVVVSGGGVSRNRPLYITVTGVISPPPPNPGSGPTLAGCPVFPVKNIWNTPVNTLPVDANSSNYIASIGANTGLHPDFGAFFWNNAPTGIPFNIVPANQATVPVSFDYASESDPGPYPIPANVQIEGNVAVAGDHHILLLQQGSCKLFEMWDTRKNANGTWSAGSGAIFDLNSNTLRTAGWTSADASGLAILPGLVRYDEVKAGAIEHALRFTVSKTRKQYTWPATHWASYTNGATLPPMGQRFRLKASFDISPFPADVQVILKAMKKYGMMITDNGGNWYISGAPDSHWNDNNMNLLKGIKGSNFEAVDVSSLKVNVGSGATP